MDFLKNKKNMAIAVAVVCFIAALIFAKKGGNPDLAQKCKEAIIANLEVIPAECKDMVTGAEEEVAIEETPVEVVEKEEVIEK